MLQKLKIIPEAPLTAFDVNFNPERYTVNKGVNIAEVCAMQISDLAEWIRDLDEPR